MLLLLLLLWVVTGIPLLLLLLLLLLLFPPILEPFADRCPAKPGAPGDLAEKLPMDPPVKLPFIPWNPPPYCRFICPALDIMMLWRWCHSAFR